MYEIREHGKILGEETEIFRKGESEEGKIRGTKDREEYEKKGEKGWKKCNFAEGKKNNGRIDEERQDVRLL